MTSATERLRALLTERGVEWGNIRNDGSESDYLTEWQFENNQGKAIAIEWAVGSGLSVEIHRYNLTPEQAIAATLGPGTCHAVFEVDAMSEDERIGEFVCSECGETFGDGRDQRPKYCPSCGRRCVG